MVISSLVVETDPSITQQVANKLINNTGVEVHEINEYKLVVTIEANTLDESHRIASSFVMVPGVIGVNLVYVNFEDDPTTRKVTTR